jgi:RHS repeat-associated protein
VIINKDLNKQVACFFTSNKQQFTSTVYDAAYAGFVGISPQPTTQRNLRNRVSYTSFANGNNPANYNQASFYTYDVEGNVDTLLQDYGSSDSTASQNVMNMNSNRWKKTVYQYDLVSGKVNTVAYQPGLADQFYHRYTYDAENRLTLAETSADSITWEKEARYQYYKHGPLARTVIGDQQVQGIDYAYTLQGWLKGVNSSSLAIGYDMGRDGDTTYMNRYVARDAFGYNLTYYAGDYSPISSSAAAPFAGYTSLFSSPAYKSLWNGNISSMVVNIGKFNNPLLYMYTYDQLNRLTAMDVDSGLNQSTNSWSSGLTGISDYKERIAYDPNGNITQYLRNGTGTVNLAMDSLSYFYNKSGGKLINNQPNYIRDEVSGMAENSNYPNDIDNQSANNYAYDSIGNLISDNAEGITSITWSVYGKILEIQRTATGTNPTTDIQYTYDAAGNRISKKVTNSSGAITYTWYSKDAQGNVMSTYSAAGSGTTLTSYSLSLSEQHLYGSSRLGIAGRTTDMKASYSPGAVINFQRGLKSYELSNHLGNVLVTVSDKKNEVSSNGTTIDNFTADIRNANDYYPFGMQQPGRAYLASANYRYGFNGKENDSEVKGTGNEQDYGMRIYDPRAGRFLSVDPLMNKYPDLTPYQFSSNSPISGVDRDGLEFMKYDKKFTATVVFPRNEYQSDGLIKAEYNYAMQANMNVLVAGSLSEINKFLDGKKTVYENILFTGHGGWNTSSIRMGDFGYHEDQIDQYKQDFREMGKYLKKDGTVCLLACFQSTPKYVENGVKDRDGKKYDIVLNGELLTKKISELIQRKVLANAGETYSGFKEFAGNFPQIVTSQGEPYSNVANKFAGKWSITLPNGRVLPVGAVTLNPDGSYKTDVKNKTKNGASEIKQFSNDEHSKSSDN